MILRKINSLKLESIINLGDKYTLVYRKYNYKEFSALFKDYFSEDCGENNEEGLRKCYAFIEWNEGESKEPLFEDEKNYIMNDGGKTFDNITCRK